jgi:hypothetical protein
VIAATDISIDGDAAWVTFWPNENDEQLATWRVAHRQCDVCDGEPVHMDTGAECVVCDGTGRHCFDINVQGYVTPLRRARYSYRMRTSVVEVLPVVEWDGQPEGIACLDTLGNVWYPDIDREGEPVHYLKDHAVLPESAAPGKWAVRLRVKM